MLSNFSRRLYSSTSRRLAEAAAAGGSNQLTINFCTPHAPVHNNKKVNMIVLPGEDGDFALTASHSPLISQLKPGIVSVVHVGGDVDKYFVPGGFALAHAGSIADISVPEAVPLSDFDESAVRAGYANAQKNANSDDTAVKTAAQIEISVFASIARAINVSL